MYKFSPVSVGLLLLLAVTLCVRSDAQDVQACRDASATVQLDGGQPTAIRDTLAPSQNAIAYKVEQDPSYSCVTVRFVVQSAVEPSDKFTLCQARQDGPCTCQGNNGAITFTDLAQDAPMEESLTIDSSIMAPFVFLLETTSVSGATFVLTLTDTKCEAPVDPIGPPAQHCPNAIDLQKKGYNNPNAYYTYSNIVPDSQSENKMLNFSLLARGADMCPSFHFRGAFTPSPSNSNPSSGIELTLVCLAGKYCPASPEAQCLEENSMLVAYNLPGNSTFRVDVTSPLRGSGPLPWEEHIGMLLQSNPVWSKDLAVNVMVIPCSGIPTIRSTDPDYFNVKASNPGTAPLIAFIVATTDTQDGTGGPVETKYYWYITDQSGQPVLVWNRVPTLEDPSELYSTEEEADRYMRYAVESISENVETNTGFVHALGSSGGNSMFVVYARSSEKDKSAVIARQYIGSSSDGIISSKFGRDLAHKIHAGGVTTIYTTHAKPSPSPSAPPSPTRSPSNTPNPTPTHTHTPTPNNGESPHTRLSGGAIAAILVGVFVFVLCMIYFCCRHRRHHHHGHHQRELFVQPGPVYVQAQPVPQMHSAPGPQPQPYTPYVAMQD